MSKLYKNIKNKDNFNKISIKISKYLMNCKYFILYIIQKKYL